MKAKTEFIYKFKEVLFIKNKYIIDGDITLIFVNGNKNALFVTLIDTKHFDKVNSFEGQWFAQYQPTNNSWYVRNSITYKKEDGTWSAKATLLHNLIMDVKPINNKIIVDHHGHNTLDNRECNLFVNNGSNNSANRKGVNRNSKTGVRNVNWIERSNEYWVQICCKGVRYKRVFQANQFEEACKHAKEKREELFGEFAGNG